MALGPLMIDLAGPRATTDELERLRDPRVGGLILFTRNFLSVEQLQSLVGEVRASRPDILVAVDHEGGRVQRFRDGFTRLPSMRRIGELYERAPAEGIAAARDIAFVLASELRLCGVDLSFTPVLDLDWARSGVIGDRSFHRDPAVVATLGQALVEGLHAAGMAACGKHFPGHGWAEADSHLAVPVDERSLDRLQADLSPFRKVAIDAVMPAHVIYPAMDHRPAGFSPVWHRYLREDVGFNGVVFSDDLSMEGASVAGGVLQRVDAAWTAGCDMLLLCNAPDRVAEVLDHWNPAPDPVRSGRLQAVRRRPPACTERQQLVADARWQRGHQHCQVLTA
jgi:beta-N-acetylhexosaminidase